jgi:hypothetical protein
MKKNEIEIGKVYVVKVSGNISKVRIVSESIYGGWNGRNLATGRDVRIRTAARLRREVGAVVAPRISAPTYFDNVSDADPGL